MGNSDKPVKHTSKLQAKFPHIRRIFPASSLVAVAKAAGKTLYVAVFLNLLLLNISLVAPEAFKRLPTLHLILTRETDLGRVPLDLSSLTRQFNAPQGVNVLGDSTARDNQGADSYAFHLSQYRYWSSVVQSHPDYRDAHYMLAVLSYELNKPEEAKSHVQAVAALDPLYAHLPEIEALIKKN